MRPRRAGASPLDSLPKALPAAHPGFIAPALATSRKVPPVRGDWVHEIKHDGYRAQAHLINRHSIVYSRNGYDWTATFGSIAHALRGLPAKDFILDGEVVVPDANGVSDFHLLEKDLSSARVDRLVYFAFDLLYLDGYDLRNVALIERKRLLGDLLSTVPDHGRIQLSKHIEADAAAVFRQACAMHFEGIVSKERSSPYRSGRQESWIKAKCRQSDTYPIIAFVEKLGAKPRRIASLYLGRWEGDRLLYAGKAQTGFRNETLYELRELLDPHIRKTSPLTVPVKKPKATWVEPVVNAEIEFSSLTADRLLRAAVFKSIRNDLEPARPVRGYARTVSEPPVRKENILQLLPDAVAPSKEALVEYWRRVAPEALEYLARRPLKLVRHTRGTTFYHRGKLPPIPSSVRQLKIEKREGGEGTRLWVEDLDGLVGLVDMGAVELHPWNCTVDDIEHPDVLVFDLDPGPGIDWPFVIHTAQTIRELLERERLQSWPKLTGGKGIHIMAPLPRVMTHDEAHGYSRGIAERLAGSHPPHYTTSAAKSARTDRLFIDYLRNGRGTTAIGTYSPRARVGFPIAAPVTWKQLESGFQSDAFTMARPFVPHLGAQASLKRRVRTTREIEEVPKRIRGLGPGLGYED